MERRLLSAAYVLLVVLCGAQLLGQSSPAGVKQPANGRLPGSISLVDSVGAPQNLAAEPGLYGGAFLHWDSVAGCMGYSVYKSVDGAAFANIADVQRHSFLDWYDYPGHEYRYFVTAYTMMAESMHSDTAMISMEHPPVSAVHGVITGTVTDASSGHPLPGAFVRFFPPGGLWSVRTHTDTAGVYWAPLDTGRYLIHADAFLHLGEWFDNVQHVDSATVVDLHQDTVTANFSLPRIPIPVPITVSGTVTDSVTGAPLANAFVIFMRPHHELRDIEDATGLFGGFPFERFELPELGELHGVVGVGRTDSSGNYTATVLTGSRYIALAFKLGYVAKFYHNKPTALDADRLWFTGDTTGIDFALVAHAPSPYAISGSVTDSNGTGVPSFVVLFRQTLIGRIPVRFRMTDSVGGFTFYHVANGHFFIKAWPIDGFTPAWYNASSCGVTSWHNADTVRVLNASVSGLDLCVLPSAGDGFGSISGQISNGPGNLYASTPAEGVTVFAVSTTTNQALGYDVTEDDGSFSIQNLPPGSYNLVVDKEGYNASSTPTYSVDSSNNYNFPSGSVILTPEVPLSVGPTHNALPTEFRLDQNYPNPFNPSTRIRYEIPRTSVVSVKIYNLLGQEVAELASTAAAPGVYTVRWSGNDLNGNPASSGIYFIKLVATPADGAGAPFTQVRKMMLMK